jgi:hypothetical protein
MKKDLFSKNINNILSLAKSKTYTTAQINTFCNELKEKNYIAQSMTHDAFIKRLIALQKKQINITMNDKYFSIYSYDEDVTEYKMLLGYKKNSFYSMSSALNLLGVSDFRNNFIFISQELTKKNVSNNESSLSQDSIDNAFNKDYRRTNMVGKYEDQHIVFLSPKHTNYYEVITNSDGIRLSSINRAFVEMIVNVQYFKSSKDIIDVFKPLKNKLNIDAIYNVVEKFNFIYPYFQSVGFYLYQIGFKKNKLIKFKNNVGKLKFYTDKKQDSYKYNDYWRMYYI